MNNRKVYDMRGVSKHRVSPSRFRSYSSSKGCAELVASAYRNSYFNPKEFDRHGVALASVRAGNVIGGGDWAEDRLIPDIMRAITQGESVHIRNPHAIRPWQHVLEPLAGYLLLAQKLWEDGAAYGEGWNFGPNDEDAKPVSWIVERLTKARGENASWVQDSGDHPHEAHYLKLDCSKAKARLDWLPRWYLDETLGKIVDWQKKPAGRGHESSNVEANCRLRTRNLKCQSCPSSLASSCVCGMMTTRRLTYMLNTKALRHWSIFKPVKW
ncbi:MAG: Rossmann-fold NAD(P)-binding domain-containing protein [Sulfuricella sp.]